MTAPTLDTILAEQRRTNAALTLWGETQAAHGEQLQQIIELLTQEPGENPIAQFAATLDELVREVRALRADVNGVKLALATATVRGAKDGG